MHSVNNVTNHISTCECAQLKPKSFKQFEVKAHKGLKNGAVSDIIPILDIFITRKHLKSIDITLINQSDEIKWIPQGQHIGTVHLVKGRMLSEEEAW